MSTTLNESQAYRPDVDGLRAAAVLSVILFHAFPRWLSGGFVGVDVFFVISGFLITGIILQGIEAGRFSFWHFYSRRIRRIFPALILTLAGCMAFGWFTLFADEYKSLARHVMGGMAFVANFQQRSDSGYFDTAAALKPLLHLWSLGIEEQFYLFWPLFLFLSAKFVTRSSARLLLILLVTLASFAVNVATVNSDPTGNYYLPTSRMWELLVGAYLAHCHIHPQDGWFCSVRAKITPHFAGLISLVGFLLVVVSCVTLSSSSHFPGWAALMPTIGAASIIAAGPRAWVNRYVLSPKPIVFVGLISYPLYLWHWPLLSFARVITSKPSNRMVWACIAASFVLSYLTFRIVERPIRSGSRVATPIVLLLVGAGVLLFGHYVDRNDGIAGRLRPKPAMATNVLAARSGERAPPSVAGAGDGISHPNPADPGAYYAYMQDQLLWTQKGYDQSAGCVQKFSMIQLNGDGKCQISDPGRDPTVMLIGDSHANSVYYGFAKYFAQRGENLAMIGRGGCLPFWNVNSPAAGITEPPCSPLMNAILDYVVNAKGVRKVLLDDQGDIYLDGPTRPAVDPDDPSDKHATEIYERKLRATIDRLLAAQKEVILVIDQPDVEIDPRTCIGRPLSKPSEHRCTTSRKRVERLMGAYKALMREVLKDYPMVASVDLTPVFCDAKTCSIVRENRILYRDANHLSYDGSLYFADKIVISGGGGKH